MYTPEQIQQFSQILEGIAQTLDIPDTKYIEAEKRYKAVGEWLGKADSPLALHKPDIYPQGSFRLGTVVKPINREYDIDLVCQMNISQSAITQQTLKQIVGDRLKANETYSHMLDEEGRRCWTLNYAEDGGGIRFHLDILPAIPDDYHWLIRFGVPDGYAKYATCITDNKTWYQNGHWPRSNPKGYADWFKNRMLVAFEKRRQLLIENRSFAKIEEVPDYAVKTPLQRAVQLLKRHRDMYFKDDNDDRPASIIITTLAAWAYNNETNVYHAIANIAANMSKYIISENGVYSIRNPVNPAENFADKWREYPERARKFFAWLSAVPQNFTKAIEQRGFHKIGEVLSPVLGETVVSNALEQIANSYKNMREDGSLKMSDITGTLGTVGSVTVKKHNFYGD